MILVPVDPVDEAKHTIALSLELEPTAPDATLGVVGDAGIGLGTAPDTALGLGLGILIHGHGAETVVQGTKARLAVNRVEVAE